MTTIRLFCQGATARAKVDGAITAGAVGIPVEITCDSAWDGLLRTIVFMTPVSRSAVSGVEDSAVVPGGVLVPGQHLYIAMEGRDDDGDPVIPTNWADCGVIRCSSAGTDEIEYPAVPGGGSGEDGGYYIPGVDPDGNLSWTPSKSGMPAVVPANIKGPKGDTGAKGETGAKGDTGAAGYTPVKGTDYWTASERQAMIDDVLAAIPVGDEVSY